MRFGVRFGVRLDCVLGMFLDEFQVRFEALPPPSARSAREKHFALLKVCVTSESEKYKSCESLCRKNSLPSDSDKDTFYIYIYSFFYCGFSGPRPRRADCSIRHILARRTGVLLLGTQKP